MLGRVATVILLLTLVASTASAQSLRASTAAVAQQSASDWQREYDAAQARRHEGKTKMIVGSSAAVVAIFLMAADSKSCLDSAITTSPSDCSGGTTQKVGLIGMLAGSGYAAWGGIQYADANNDLNRLALQKPSKTAAVFSLGSHQAIGVSLGQSSRVSYRVSW